MSHRCWHGGLRNRWRSSYRSARTLNVPSWSLEHLDARLARPCHQRGRASRRTGYKPKSRRQGTPPVRFVRNKPRPSQAAFASRYHIPVSTRQDWEQGTSPSQSRSAHHGLSAGHQPRARGDCPRPELGSVEPSPQSVVGLVRCEQCSLCSVLPCGCRVRASPRASRGQIRCRHNRPRPVCAGGGSRQGA